MTSPSPSGEQSAAPSGGRLIAADTSAGRGRLHRIPVARERKACAPRHIRRAAMPAALPRPANVPGVIRFEKVTKTYPGGSHAALDNVSIDIEKGEFVFLVGTSGSGKSTALRLVLRETRCTKGRVYVAGKEINRLAGWKVPQMQ